MFDNVVLIRLVDDDVIVRRAAVEAESIVIILLSQSFSSLSRDGSNYIELKLFTKDLHESCIKCG